MPRRKKKFNIDSLFMPRDPSTGSGTAEGYGEWDDYPSTGSGTAEGYGEWDEGPSTGSGTAGEEQVSLRDFVVRPKVQAFIDFYTPCDEFTPGAVCFNDSKLREFFKAYVCSCGDPLRIYLNDLNREGFKLKVSEITGDPCIFALPKNLD